MEIEKAPKKKSGLESLMKAVTQKSNGGFNYSQNIVTSKDKNKNSIFNNNVSPGHLSQTKITQYYPKKIIPSLNNKRPSTFNSILGRKRPAEENTEKLVNKKYKEDLKHDKELKENKQQKKTIKKLNKPHKEKSDWLNGFASYIDVDPKEIKRIYNEGEKKRKEEEEKKQTNYNLLLERNLMGTKERKFMTQKEEEEERLKIKNSIFSIDLNMNIPYINQIRQNNLDKYKSFHPLINDIYKNVLNFNFYFQERQTEEIPNTFENEAHYRYVWITDFFNELKYCLLNEKIEKSEVQNYEEADIKIDLLKGNDIDNDLTLMKINTNKKLYELKKRILKDNDIIALYNEKYTFDKNQITLKNENSLNYFLGIVTRDCDSNDLNLYVLRAQYISYLENCQFMKENNNSSICYNKIKYLGSINSSLREYKALFDLELSNFTGIIKTDSIFFNSNLENLNSKPILNINPLNYYLSEKETFLKNLLTSNLFNDPQKNAIIQANNMKKNEILLIQGPPGTGKTHTILGLISMLLKTPHAKILVCAPSNAAIDEICARLANKGIYNSELTLSKSKFLRFGLYDRKDKEKKYLETSNGKILEKYSLEYLSDQKYKKDIDTTTERLENLRKQLNNLNKEKLKEKDNVKLNNIIGAIKNTEVGISNCLKLLSDKRYQKNQFEQEILVTTPILCTTLNNAGNDRLKRARLSYEYLIVDEASQCVEPLCLIPLYHDVKKLVLVGDHMQLPATVFYPKASKILYNRSLFERLIDNKYPRFILTVQYRMQKNISEFISKTFYENKLTNDENHVDKINKELIYDIIKIGNNFSFFDVHYGEEFFDEERKSYINKDEMKFSFGLIKKIISEIRKKTKLLEEEKEKKKKENEQGNKNENNPVAINELNEKIKTLRNYKFAIICPYKSQVMKFRDRKKRDDFFKERDMNDIEINTVDSFQGQERDIIIVSTVRANFKEETINLEEGEIPQSGTSPQSNDNESNEKDGKNNIGIGFLNDFRRMNVGLSRAKACCFVVGHYETLKNNNYWNKLMNYCKEKNSFFKVDKDDKSVAMKNIFV